MTEIESDSYRTKDGKYHFSFSFLQEGDFYEIDVIYAPSEINLNDKPLLCNPSKRNGFTIITDQKGDDVFTAKLIAGDWAEKLCNEL